VALEAGQDHRAVRAGGSATSPRAPRQYLEAHARQPVVVEKSPAPTASSATEAAKSAAADGYIAALTTNTTHAANASLYRKLPYDPLKDFEARRSVRHFRLGRRRAAAERHKSIADS